LQQKGIVLTYTDSTKGELYMWGMGHRVVQAV
jgi:hypothetical protein